MEIYPGRVPAVTRNLQGIQKFGQLLRAAADVLECLLPIRIFRGQYQVHFYPVRVCVDRTHPGHRDRRLPITGAIRHPQAPAVAQVAAVTRRNPATS